MVGIAKKWVIQIKPRVSLIGTTDLSIAKANLKLPVKKNKVE